MSKKGIAHMDLQSVQSNSLLSFHVNPIPDGGLKSISTSSSPATSTNAVISPQNFLTYRFNPFAMVR